MKKSRVMYVLGNEVEPLDKMPIKLFPHLRKMFPQITFQRLDPTEELPVNEPEEFILIDTVMGISKVEMINDLNHLSLSPRVTLHDYDLPLSLGLAKKLGKIKKVTIIGVPPKGNQEVVLKEIIQTIRKLISNASTT